MKILTVLGARPQFIKAGSVSREIAQHKELQEIIVHTGQHYDANMSNIFFEQMKIPKPDYFLGVGGKTHAAMTGQMMEKIEKVAMEKKPDLILVYGDTNSTLAGALVASKLHIKLVHVEAGLRSFNMQMPEEINRILTDRLSQILFCPTDMAVQNLEKEGFSNFAVDIIKNGDVMQDGAMFYKSLARKPNVSIKEDFVLCTVHRAENTDNEERIKNIFKALSLIAKEMEIVVPIHPRTEKILKQFDIPTDDLTIIEPVGYLEMVWLIDNCKIVITDSGGLQKEAFFFQKPCITLRDETEWVELVENNFNILCGSNIDTIYNSYKNHIFNENFNLNLYGNANASKKIVSLLLSINE